MNKVNKYILLGAVSGLTLITGQAAADPIEDKLYCNDLKYPQYELKLERDTCENAEEKRTDPYTS